MYEKSYEKEITVYQYECDVKNRMTAAALLKQVQQISTEHCDIFGLDAAYYQSTNTAFLLSKISLLFHREILVGEKLKLVTQPSLPVKAVYHRYTSAYDDQGKEAPLWTAGGFWWIPRPVGFCVKFRKIFISLS